MTIVMFIIFMPFMPLRVIAALAPARARRVRPGIHPVAIIFRNCLPIGRRGDMALVLVEIERGVEFLLAAKAVVFYQVPRGASAWAKLISQRSGTPFSS